MDGMKNVESERKKRGEETKKEERKEFLSAFRGNEIWGARFYKPQKQKQNNEKDSGKNRAWY